MRYFVECERDGKPGFPSKDVENPPAGFDSPDTAIYHIDHKGARDIVYRLIEVSADAGTRILVSQGKPGDMREIETPPYFADPDTARSFCDFTPPQPVTRSYKAKYHVERKYPDGWRDTHPLRRFSARLDAVREVYVSYGKSGVFRIIETTPDGRIRCVGWMDFGPGPKTMRDPTSTFKPGDKVRVTYETEVIPNRSRFNRSADDIPLIAVRRPGSRSGPTTVPMSCVELINEGGSNA